MSKLDYDLMLEEVNSKKEEEKRSVFNDELKKRLNVSEIDKSEISISPFGTVNANIGATGQSSDKYSNKYDYKELAFKDFLKLINTNIDKGINTVKYDKEANKFYLIIKNERGYANSQTARVISVDEQMMKDYADGRRNKITLNLEDLCKKCEAKEELNIIKKEKEEEKNQIVIKANKGLDKLTPIEAKTYLDYLQNQDREKRKDITKQGAKLFAAAGAPLAGGLIAGAVCFAPGVAFLYTAIAAALGVTVGSLSEGIFNMFVRGDSYFEIFPLDTIKKLARDIKERRQEIRVNKIKERELLKIPYVDKMVLPNSVTVKESEPIEHLDLNDHILKEINDMVDKISLVRPEARGNLLDEAKNLLDNYMERSTNIINRDKSMMDPNADNLVNLRIDMCKKLAQMEMKLSDIKTKDTKTKAITHEGKLLTDKIDKIGPEKTYKKVSAKKSEDLDKMFIDENAELNTHENVKSAK